MIKCNKCGAEMDDDCTFCVNCGNSLETVSVGQQSQNQSDQNSPKFSQQPMQPGYPQQPMQPGYPQQPMQPGYPQQPMQQGYPQQPMQQGYPQQPMQQGYPQQPMQQGYPQQPMQQGYPQQPMQQGYPQQPMQQGYPQQPMQQSYMQQPQQHGLFTPQGYNPALPTLSIHWKPSYFLNKMFPGLKQISIKVNGVLITPPKSISYREFTVPVNHYGGDLQIEIEYKAMMFRVNNRFIITLQPGMSYNMELTNKYLVQSAHVFGYQMFDANGFLLYEDKAPTLHRVLCLCCPIFEYFFADKEKHEIKYF